MELSHHQLNVIETQGHLLVIGGPGSGKTTVSILKAAQIAKSELRPGQKVLFLSFARATISRVMEAIEQQDEITNEQKRRIDVDTYHSFFWRILKTHGYLLGLPRKLTILTPPAEAIALSSIRNQYSIARNSTLNDSEKEIRRLQRTEAESIELLRLAHTEGRVCFDLFSRFVGTILDGSERIRAIIATMYPVIILDEFQDTNHGQWKAVEALGDHSTLIALADPEQRIYDWIGADPERLNHFVTAFQPSAFNLEGANHRSAGTEIAEFGNHVLTGKFQRTYTGVHIETYDPAEKVAMTRLVLLIYEARGRLIASGIRGWSIAVLVATKKMTRTISDALYAPPAGLTKVSHTASVEMDGAILGSETIAFLMQPDTNGRHFEFFIKLLCDYFRGKGGDSPTQGDLQEANNLQDAYSELMDRRSSGRAIRSNSIIAAVLDVYTIARSVKFTGNPDTDWLAIRNVLSLGRCTRLKGLAEETRNLRLLRKGTQLRELLSQDWRDHGTYSNALPITQQAFVREHFSTNSKPESGVVVMNMHKAKGKQFDEVIIFDAWPRTVKRQIVANLDRVVWNNSRTNINDQTCQNFRVSVTRAKSRITIMTPSNDPCVLLHGR